MADRRTTDGWQGFARLLGAIAPVTALLNVLNDHSAAGVFAAVVVLAASWALAWWIYRLAERKRQETR